MKIEPTNDNILIEQEKGDAKTKSGIYVPPEGDSYSGKPERGIVAAVDKGVAVGKYKKGDEVFFNKYGPSEISLDGKVWIVAHEDDIIAVIKK